MFELIATIILIISFCGVAFILFKKLPVLATMPPNTGAGIREHHIVLEIESKIKDFLLAIEKQIFLHKILSWVKCLTLKIETRVDHLLHSIRKKAQNIDKEINEKK